MNEGYVHYKRWLTCAPKPFRGDEKTFFSRDSGLCCRALQSLGCEAKVVLPEPAWDDEVDVLRVPYARLEDPEFWRTQDVEAVILYAWADPRYTSIAKAIQSAGLRLYVNMDTGGLISPFVEPWVYARAIWMVERQKRGAVLGGMSTLARLGWHCIGLHKHFLRLQHMSCADSIGVVSPIGMERVRQYARFFHREDIAKKVHFIPHPINPAMRYDGQKKEPQVVAVGRWNDVVQKRPEMLIEVAAKVLERHATVRFVIAGKDAIRCVEEILDRVPEVKGRVVGHDRLEHDELCEQMVLSQISLCTSRYESFHIASGEALLCGCSVVAPESPSLPSLQYFIDKGLSGRLSENNSASLADAVLAELDAWKSGERDAESIAHIWRDRIAAEVVVRQIDGAFFAETTGLRG